MREWIAKVRVVEVREVIVEGETKKEAELAAERQWKHDDRVTLDLVDWEVEDVRPKK